MIRKLTAKGYSEGDWACPTHPIMSKHVNGEVEYNNAMQAWMDDKSVTSVLVDDGTTVVEFRRSWVGSTTSKGTSKDG